MLPTHGSWCPSFPPPSVPGVRARRGQRGVPVLGGDPDQASSLVPDVEEEEERRESGEDTEEARGGGWVVSCSSATKPPNPSGPPFCQPPHPMMCLGFFHYPTGQPNRRILPDFFQCPPSIVVASAIRLVILPPPPTRISFQYHRKTHARGVQIGRFVTLMLITLTEEGASVSPPPSSPPGGGGVRGPERSLMPIAALGLKHRQNKQQRRPPGPAEPLTLLTEPSQWADGLVSSPPNPSGGGPQAPYNYG